MIRPNEINILLVDDRRDGIVALEAALGGKGYNLVSAYSGAEALLRLEEHEFALILMDVQMPIMDGFEVARRIKLVKEWQHVPIIFVTAINKDDRYVGTGYELGAVDYLFKPFDVHTLRSKVHVFVELYKKTKEVAAQAVLLRESERRDQLRNLVELELESLRRYRNLADAIPSMVWKAKQDGNMDYFNRAWSTYTGLTTEQSIGSGWHSAFEPNDLQRFLKIWIDSMIKGVGFSVECRIKEKATDSWRWHVVRVIPESTHEGRISCWLGTGTDIHDQKEWESQLAAAKDAAEYANHAKSTFLANMSHEIRTPLNAILGFSELLLESGLGEETRIQNASIIRRNGHQLLKIIDEILDLSKIEANRLEVENLPTDIEHLCAELNSLFSLKASEGALHLRFTADGPVPRIIHTDPTRLRQILVNIIGNALKFTPRGSVDVTVRHRKIDSLLEIDVSDTGIGMTLEEAQKLFTPFTQVDGSTSRKFGGTGLGLALSRKLANALGGGLDVVKCEPEKGSTFRITVATGDVSFSPMLVRLHVDVAHDGEVADGKRLSGLGGVKILLVDDAPDNQRLISRFLQMAGAEVELASDGFEAVQKGMQDCFDIILMDIQMPGLDGYEATRRLRELKITKPIIALTAHALKEERERCLSVGCDGHLTKPVKRRELIENIADFVLTSADRQNVHPIRIDCL